MKERNEFAEKDGSFEHATLSKDGIFGKTARYDRDFLVSTENKKYKVTHINDLCYNPANLKFGVICLNKYGDAIFSPIYVTFEIQNDYDADFVGENLSRWDFINKALRYQQGTVYERMAVSSEDFLRVKCYMPSKREQEKLSRFIGLLDEKIVCQRKYIDVLKKYKRGLLSFVFNKYIIEDVDSTSYLFSELAQRRKEKYSPSCGIEYPCIELEHIEQATGKILGTASSITQNSIKTVVRTGDILFGKLRPYLRKFAFADQDMVCSSEIWVFIPSDLIIPKFLYYLVQTEHFLRVANISSGTKMPRAEWSNIEKESFNIPNFTMQAKIVEIMEAVDRKIYIADNILNLLTKMKESLLQQLFI